MKIKYYKTTGIGYGIWCRKWFNDTPWEFTIDFWKRSLVIYFK